MLISDRSQLFHIVPRMDQATTPSRTSSCKWCLKSSSNFPALLGHPMPSMLEDCLVCPRNLQSVIEEANNRIVKLQPKNSVACLALAKFEIFQFSSTYKLQLRLGLRLRPRVAETPTEDTENVGRPIARIVSFQKDLSKVQSKTANFEWEHPGSGQQVAKRNQCKKM